MVMLRPAGKPYKIAKEVLANKGVKVPKPRLISKSPQLVLSYIIKDKYEEKKVKKKVKMKMAKAGHEYNMSEKHKKAESMGMKKSMKGC